MLPILILIAITPAMAAGFGKPFEHPSIPVYPYSSFYSKP